MGDFRHIRNGVVISEPRNWDELEIECDFMNRTDEANINISGLEFAGDVAIDIRNRIMDGLTSGVGVFEGDPYQIDVGEEGNIVFSFKGYLDYADDPEFIGCNGVKVALKKRQGSDWLNDVADGFSFRYLHEIGVITANDFVAMPYVINYIPDNMQLLILGMSLFMMTKELISAIRSLAEAIGDTTSGSTPVVGTSVGLGAGVVTAWSIGQILLTVLKVAAYVAYTIAIIVAIKNLIEQIIEQLLPKKRNHLGMTLYDLFERACQHLGMGFSSTLLNQRRNWTIIPHKGHKGGEKPEGFVGSWTEAGVPDQDDGMDTFGDLIRVWKEWLNADFKIIDNVFYFERADFWDGPGTYSMPNVFTDQKELIDRYKLNTNEVLSNYSIYWAYDSQDQNTLENQQGRVFQVITEPNIKINKDLINLQNLEEIALGCSMALRKDSLTRVEEVLKKVAKFIDDLTGFLGGGTSYAAKIEDRKGSCLMSSHFLTRPKMVVMSGGKLATNQRDLLSAERLWHELHSIRSFVKINGRHNQWIRYENVKVPFCWESFVVLVENNKFLNEEGQECKIEKFKWKIWEDSAVLTFRKNEEYTKNLKLKYVT